MEDALLLQEAEDTDRALNFAMDRLMKHEKHEQERKRNGLETDLERYLGNERILD